MRPRQHGNVASCFAWLAIAASSACAGPRHDARNASASGSGTSPSAGSAGTHADRAGTSAAGSAAGRGAQPSAAHGGSGDASGGGGAAGDSHAAGGVSSAGAEASSAGTAGGESSGKRYGFTLDSVDNLSAIVESLQRLPKRALVRIVFDYPELPSSYAQAVASISAVADIVGQPSDSTYSSKLTVSQFADRFEAYVSAFPSIDIWEACNECNGAWGGPNTAAQADAAYDVIRAHGKRVLYTPYWNGHDCADSNGDYIGWTRDHISDKLKQGMDFVTVSIYGVDCTGVEPSYAELDAMFQAFGAMFPNAKLGIGEYGAKDAGDKRRVLEYYLDYPASDPRYIFWGGYWYGRQDFVPVTQPLWQVFADAMK
jgi:hypothetical protein